MTHETRRFQELAELTNRMLQAWSPLLQDRLINIYIAAIDERRHLSDEDVIAILGFDPANVDELKPPWRNPEFK